MFKSTAISSVTLALLLNDARAVKYRPPERTPWYKKSSVGDNEDPEYPINYVVPNFGADPEMATSQRNLAQAEKSLNTELRASFKKPKSHPIDYKTPNFGIDRDIGISLGNLKQSEEKLKHKWVPASAAQIKAAKYPKDYFVPNFGQDRDIKISLQHTTDAEKNLKHKWVPKTKAEIKAAQYPKDYFVPNFGVDKDIKMTQAHIAEQEKLQKHEWKPVQDENGVWLVPEARTKYSGSLVQTEADEQSDPTCSSAGCNYASEKGKKTHPMNYFVPNFGRDRDINTSFNSLEWAEKQLGHHWVVDFDKMKEKGPPKDYPVPNFGVDEDVKMTQAHVAEQEKKLKHVWKPVQDENGVWIVPEANKNSSYSYRSLVQTDEQSDPTCSSAGCNYASEKGKKTHPMNYFVPNFGRDRDINTSFNSLEWAEKQLSHHWVVDFDKMKEKGPPKDYPVPNFGVDEDVKMTQAHVAEQEKKLGHVWKPVQDENGVWIVPEANKNSSYSYRSLLQTGSEVNLASDPVCSSAGCTYPSEKKTHKMNYFVPNFGRDEQINETDNSLLWAEQKLNHHWIPKEKPKTVEKPITYDDEKKGIESDIQDSLANLKEQESKLGAWNIPQQKQ